MLKPDFEVYNDPFKVMQNSWWDKDQDGLDLDIDYQRRSHAYASTFAWPWIVDVVDWQTPGRSAWDFAANDLHPDLAGWLEGHDHYVHHAIVQFAEKDAAKEFVRFGKGWLD